jgi:hypothetical protein
MCAGGMPHIIGKHLKRVTTFLETPSQSNVFIRSYGLPKCPKSQFKKIRDSQLGSLGKNALWSSTRM